MAVFPVVLDACVLFPFLVRDILLRATEAGLYQPYWSQEILDEATRNLIERSKIQPKQAQHLISEMSKFFPEAMVEVPAPLVTVMPNHPKDRHVAATALIARAGVIVTFNLKDFKKQDLEPYRIEAQSPDTYLNHLYSLFPDEMKRVIYLCATDRSKAVTEQELLDRLKPNFPKFTKNFDTSGELK